MDYENKYKDALSRASKLRVQNPFDTVGQMVEYIFPELKESEDEKIRKAILELVRQSSEILDKQNQNNMINWLEKQGKQKEKIFEFKVPDWYEFKASDWYVSKVDGKIRNIYQSVDKVEPKFKAGDWIVSNEGKCNKIKSVYAVDGGYYIATDKDGEDNRICFGIANEYFHLWTIEDAKDGDVLVGKDGRPFIFTGEFDVQDDNPTAYCGINSIDLFITGKGSHWTFKDGIKPATKEQRNLLFAKMRDSGYEWDAKRKELKKMKVANKKIDDAYLKGICDAKHEIEKAR